MHWHARQGSLASGAGSAGACRGGGKQVLVAIRRVGVVGGKGIRREGRRHCDGLPSGVCGRFVSQFLLVGV